MDDLVQRLRSGSHNAKDETLGGVKHDRRCLEAADEIERLRFALAERQRQDDEAERAAVPRRR